LFNLKPDYIEVMPQPRKRQVSLDDTPYYHCISRCVRRAFLCGRDTQTGFDFEHRRQWIVNRIKLLCSVYAIDLCAYAIMSNHYHVVVRIDVERAETWSNEEVARRWLKIFTGPTLMRQYLAGAKMRAAELDRISKFIITWRKRLCDLSWFMRCVNEPIARMANAEDDCTGRFWEGRFKSQALLGKRALLACMAYVDLNPVRAAMAKTAEQSDFTSIQERIRDPQNSCLMLFDPERDKGLPCNLEDYLELVDWGGRAVEQRKRGFSPAGAPRLLTRLRLDASPVLDYLGKSEPRTFGALGPVSRLRAFASSLGRSFVKGQALGRRLCPEKA
jgi:REP element-mobilizing transposase RayT